MDSRRLPVPQIVAEDQNSQSAILPSTDSSNRQDEVALGDILPEDRLRSVWERGMKGADGSWQPHKEAWVLMISWADELDNMKTTDEVTKLSNVFSEKFNYGVVQARIQISRSLPRQQVQRDLANFVCEHDAPGHLLIIYYAGHGSKGPPGTLNLTSTINSRPKDEITERNAIPWHEVESIVKGTRADILTIFDCCYAGNLCMETRSPDPVRNFEFLGAAEDGTTPSPGSKSFTSALIWALEILSTLNTPFSTTELIYYVAAKAPHFPKKQRPVLKQRDEPSNRRLMLAPIPNVRNLVQLESSHLVQGQSLDPQADIKRSVDLRFFFKDFPTEEDITRLSKKMRALLDEGEFPATHISWVGLCQRNLVRNAAKKWLSIIPSRLGTPTSSRNTMQTAPPSPISPQDSSGDTPPGPRAMSGLSRKRKPEDALIEDNASPTKYKLRKPSSSF